MLWLFLLALVSTAHAETVTITFDECPTGKLGRCTPLRQKGLNLHPLHFVHEGGTNYAVHPTGLGGAFQIFKLSYQNRPVSEAVFEFADLPGPNAIYIEVTPYGYKIPEGMGSYDLKQPPPLPRFSNTKAGRERITVSLPEGFFEFWIGKHPGHVQTTIKLDSITFTPAVLEEETPNQW